MYHSVVNKHGWTSTRNDTKLDAASCTSIALNIEFAVVGSIYDGFYIQSYASIYDIHA